VRYAGAYTTFHARLDVIRSRIATLLAQRARDPESTSQIIRDLRARRVVEASGPMPAVPGYPSAAAVESAMSEPGATTEAPAVDGPSTTWGFEH
jgi:hypothetical protein